MLGYYSWPITWWLLGADVSALDEKYRRSEAYEDDRNHDREVRANRIRKSVGAENTFSSDLTEFEPMVAELQPLIDKVWRTATRKARGAGR